MVSGVLFPNWEVSKLGLGLERSSQAISLGSEVWYKSYIRHWYKMYMRIFANFSHFFFFDRLFDVSLIKYF